MFRWLNSNLPTQVAVILGPILHLTSILTRKQICGHRLSISFSYVSVQTIRTVVHCTYNVGAAVPDSLTGEMRNTKPGGAEMRCTLYMYDSFRMAKGVVYTN